MVVVVLILAIGDEVSLRSIRTPPVPSRSINAIKPRPCSEWCHDDSLAEHLVVAAVRPALVEREMFDGIMP